jgi:exonuclease III
MNKKGETNWLAIFSIILVLLALYILAEKPDPDIKSYESRLNNTNETITIANWNLQIFGDSKASNPKLILKYRDRIDDYDIVFIQEIRDEDGSAFALLCAALPDYNCKISSRAGRSTSKEQYGVIYKKWISLSMQDYNPDAQDRWERPPIKVTLFLSTYNVTIFNIHTKPEDVKNELRNLELIANKDDYTMIIGDLNADCDYYKVSEEPEFNNWNWLIPYSADTTSGKTDCVYDQIILAPKMAFNVKRYGIDDSVTPEESDHYLVWVEITR